MGKVRAFCPVVKNIIMVAVLGKGVVGKSKSTVGQPILAYNAQAELLLPVEFYPHLPFGPDATQYDISFPPGQHALNHPSCLELTNWRHFNFYRASLAYPG